jgi:hypothetical protein
MSSNKITLEKSFSPKHSMPYQIRMRYTGKYIAIGSWQLSYIKAFETMYDQVQFFWSNDVDALEFLCDKHLEFIIENGNHDIRQTLKRLTKKSYRQGIIDTMSFCVNLKNIPEHIRQEAFLHFKIKP